MIRSSPVFLLLFLLLAACRSAQEKETATPAAWRRDSVLARVDDGFDDPAEIVPADALLYLRVARASAILENERDPLVEEVWQLIEENIPEEVWDRAAENLGVDRRSFVGDLFGQDLTLVDLRHGGKRRAVVLSRPRLDRIRDLPAAMGLAPWRKQERVGPWRLYRGEVEEKAYLMALGRRWLAITSIEGAGHLRRILTARAAGEPTLTDDEKFRTLFGRLPAPADAFVYTRSSDGDDRHAISLRYRADALEADYAARARRVGKYVDPLRSIPTAEFGPLPDDVVVAGTLSMLTREIPGESFLDLLLFPDDFRDDVLPFIRPPFIFFLGKVDRERFSPDPGFTVPVAGLAFRLRDQSVTPALDRLFSRLHFLLSVSRLALIEGFLGTRREERGDLDYHVADFGPIIFSTADGPIMDKLADLPQAKLLTEVSYGRVGDYYVVCNQEEFLRTWSDSASGARARLKGAADFGDFALGARHGLVASVVTRGRQLTTLVKELSDFFRDALGEEAARTLADQGEEERVERRKKEKLEEPLRWLASGFRNRRVVSVQVWRGDEGLLRGRLVARP